MTVALTIGACLLFVALVVLAVEVVERRQIRRQAEVRKQRRKELAGPPSWLDLAPKTAREAVGSLFAPPVSDWRPCHQRTCSLAGDPHYTWECAEAKAAA